ncbi:hypothetical protein [Streptomyces syringium]|uniref:hypothetical protein n=1 Tax=Streptomyces syringium TaxID=76729 RepID=UPI00343E710F
MFRAVIFTRWLHLVMATVLATVCALVHPGPAGLGARQAAWLLVPAVPPSPTPSGC